MKIKIGNHRWIICALLFFATTVNYLDRTILGILAPTLQREIGWTTIEYGFITTIFQAAYAVGSIFFGWFIDQYGAKIGYSISIVGWSIAAMALPLRVRFSVLVLHASSSDSVNRATFQLQSNR